MSDDLPVLAEEATRKIRVSVQVMEKLMTRDAHGNLLTVDWGEPDDDGFYEPMITVDYDDNPLRDDNERLRAALTALIASLTFRDRPRLEGEQGGEIKAAIEQARAALTPGAAATGEGEPSAAADPHEPHYGNNHTDYACGFSGPHCWECDEPWPCRASRGIPAAADPLDVEALAEALFDVTDQRGSIDLGAADRAFGGGEPFRTIAAELAAAYAAALDASG